MGEEVYLGLGTNKGERESNLRRAVDLIEELPTVKLVATSAIYETAPWGYTEQNDFLNMCLKIRTDLAPKKLLAKLQQIEEKLGRIREERWGPRVIDIDILIYDNLQVETAQLTIPHPRIEERSFVLIPLQELEPDLVLNGSKIDHYLAQIEGQQVSYYSEY
jgi:2-amino-4-hydroxy-6-hydroxymethyldihydropteridine diphosphokinase